MNSERKAILDRMHGIVSPDKLTKKQRQIWEYLRLHPDETNYSIIARGAKVNRHTAAKHYEMVREMLELWRKANNAIVNMSNQSKHQESG